MNRDDAQTALRHAQEAAAQTGHPICLDSSALIAYLANEAHARHIAPLIEDPRHPLVISTITLAEATVQRAMRSREAAEHVVAGLRQFPSLTWIVVDDAVALEAAVVRAETRLHLLDAIIVASARISSAVAIVGNDRRWQRHRLGVPFICLDDLP